MAAAAGEQRSFESALATTLEDVELSFSLRKEQRTALKSFFKKEDVFGVLPTGHGKSLIYQLAPLVGKRSGWLALSYFVQGILKDSDLSRPSD